MIAPLSPRVHRDGLVHDKVYTSLPSLDKIDKTSYTYDGKGVLHVVKLLTISQAAELLGIHPNTLRKWADEGLVPHTKFPGSRYRRFKREDIERFEREHLHRGGATTDKGEQGGG